MMGLRWYYNLVKRPNDFKCANRCWEEAISRKRLLISGSLVVVLLAVAGILELLLLVFPASPPGPSPVGRPSPVTVAQSRTQQLAGDAHRRFDAQAARLQETGTVVVDGEPLGDDRAFALVAAAQDWASAVAFIDQREVLASGCELVALAAMLQAQGYEPDLESLVTEHLRIGNDFVTEYLGDPRVNGGGFPISVADAANSWMAANGLEGRALDLTGTDFDALLSLVDLGYPVAIWVTEDMRAPSFVGVAKDGLQWYGKEHCVVLYGREGDDVLVADSLRGDVRSPAAAVQKVYDGCGKLALMVDPAAEQGDGDDGSPRLLGAEGSSEWNAEHSTS